MPAGLELYNTDGSLYFGTTDRAFKKQGEVIAYPGSSGSIDIPLLANSNYAFGYTIRPGGDFSIGSYSPNLSINGTTMSYSPSNVRFQSPPNTVIIEYGVY